MGGRLVRLSGEIIFPHLHWTLKTVSVCSQNWIGVETVSGAPGSLPSLLGPGLKPGGRGDLRGRFPGRGESPGGGLGEGASLREATYLTCPWSR